jgi:hypothetical protein
MYIIKNGWNGSCRDAWLCQYQLIRPFPRWHPPPPPPLLSSSCSSCSLASSLQEAPLVPHPRVPFQSVQALAYTRQVDG